MSFIFSVFVNILMLTGPLFMLQVYDRVLGSNSQETLVALFLLVGFLYGMMALLDYARGRIVARYGARFQSLLDRRIFAATLTRAGEARKNPSTGLRDLEAIQTLFSSPVFLAMMDMPWSPLFIAAIFIFHPLLGWLSVAGATVLVTLTLLNQVLTHSKVMRAQQASHGAHLFAEQSEHSHELIRAQGMRSAVTERWLVQRNASLKEKISSNDWTGSFTSTTKAFRLFLQSAMLALGAWLVLQGEMTAGAMIAGSIMLGRALAPIEMSLGQWPLIQRARSAWVSLGEMLSETAQQPERVQLPAPEARLQVRGMTIVPPGSYHATLKQISFEVRPGMALGVIGKSGAGKSTLAKAMLGLTQPAAGEIRLGGAKLDQYDPDALGSYIGYLPQQVTLLSGTIAENIARMSVSPDEEQVVDAAKRANAHDMILELPDGYNTYIAGSNNLLSGGQRQRIALARAIYGNPVLLILDEPNSALDTDGSNALNDAVKALKAENKAVIIMTHRPLAISECDELVIIDKGMVVAAGPRDEVLQNQVKNADEIGRKLKTAGTGTVQPIGKPARSLKEVASS